jgi:ankyrin repeat protein
MTRLDELPIELLLYITEYLSNQSDINAFVQTNWNLYRLLHFFLCRYNVRHHQSSALLWAARNGDAHLVTKLLNAGANIAALELPIETDHDIFTDVSKIESPLLLAAQGGHIAILKSMLSETRPGQACSPAQLRTVIHWAILSRDRELVELMIHHKAPLDPAGEEWEALSALSAAVVSKDESIIRRMLSIGAWNGPNELPCPIARAIDTGQPHVAKLLLDHGIRLCTDTGLCFIASRNDTITLQHMIDCGLDLSIDGHTALFTAIMDGQYEMVEFLIEKGANPHLVCELLTSGEGNSLKALYYSSIEFAIHFRHLPILKLLLAKGVLPDQDGLPLAVEKEFEEAVALLSEFSDQHLPLKELLEDFLDRQQSNGRDIGLDFDIPHKGWAIFDSNMPKEAEKLADPSL